MADEPEWDAGATRRMDADRTRPAASAPELMTGDGLTLQAVIAEGGMGLVHLASQQTIGREVAVKVPHPDRDDPLARQQLLLEGRVTGTLDHPNIVPVHDIAVDHEGRPMIVMKKIDGAGWDELLRDPDTVVSRYGARDLLEWHLRTLLSVSNAVRYAHSKGILHRDLKPDNVMVGEFGEVYVVDWGIAASFTGDIRLPPAVADGSGSPHYLPPEMLLTDTVLDPRTDVYLLGAVLFEIWVGYPPHAAYDSGDQATREVRIPASRSGELADVISRAMAPDPADRYPRVQELQAAIRLFLDHRSSTAITSDADAALTRLEALVASPEVADDPAKRREVFNAFGVCRFGYEHALSTWNDNPRAYMGRQRALAAMVQFELKRGDPTAASQHLEAIDLPEPQLRERVRAANDERNEEARQLDRLHRLGRDVDPRSGRRERAILGAAFGTLLTITPAVGALVPALQPKTYMMAVAWPTALLFIVVALTFLLRGGLAQTAFNRRLVRTICFGIVMQIFGGVGCYAMEIPLISSEILFLLLWSGVAAMLATLYERSLYITSFAYLLGYVYALAVPEHRYWAMAAANFVLMVNMIVAGRLLKPAKTTAP